MSEPIKKNPAAAAQSLPGMPAGKTSAAPVARESATVAPAKLDRAADSAAPAEKNFSAATSAAKPAPMVSGPAHLKRWKLTVPGTPSANVAIVKKKGWLHRRPRCRPALRQAWTRLAPRLKLPMCYTAADLESSLADKWSAFNPVKMLPLFNGDMKKAFRWWCKWVFHVAGRGPGKKMVVIPEVWRHCNPDTIPPELALLAQAGRELHVEMIVDTQRPEMLNGSLTASLTELIIFRQMSPEARRVTEKLLWETGNGFNAEQLRALPLGSFVGFNRLSGASEAGSVF